MFFIVGFKGMSLLVIVCWGIVWVGYGMLIVIVGIFFVFGLKNIVLMFFVFGFGVLVVWIFGKWVKMIDML